MDIKARKQKLLALLLAVALFFSITPVHGAEIEPFANEGISVLNGDTLKNLADGVYKINGRMLKPDGSVSMSDGAITHTLKLTVKDGKYNLTLNFKGMNITGLHGYLSAIKYFESGYGKDKYGNPTGTTMDVTVDNIQKYTDGTVVKDDFGTNYPDHITFPMISEALEDGKVPMQVYVPIMEAIQPGNGTQKVYLTLDWTTLKAATDQDQDFDQEDVVEEAPKPDFKPQPTPVPETKPVVKAPSAPSSVKAVGVAYNKVKVTWKNVSGASGYEVYQNNKKIADVKGTSYTKSGLIVGSKYSYKIRAYKTASGKKLYSSYSKTVSVRPSLKAAASVKVKKASLQSAKITWKKVSGASGYVVYRAEKSKGKYKTVKTITKGSAVSYTNKKLKKKKYYYRVRAYRTVGKKKVYAPYSKTVSVKIKK